MKNPIELSKTIANIFMNLSKSHKFSAFTWFSFSFIVYYTILKVAGYSAAAGYAENSVRPFLKETIAVIHDTTVDRNYIGNIFSIRYLDALKKWNQKELLRLEQRSLVSDEETTQLEILDKIQAIEEQNDEINERIDELVAIEEKIENDGAILIDDFKFNYFLFAYLPKLVDKHFDEKNAAEFSVKRIEGFWGGGLVINKMFVTHWLWYMPLIISVFYVSLDLISSRQRKVSQ